MNNSGFLTIEQRNELKAIARKPSEMNGVGQHALALLWLDDDWSYEQVAAALFINNSILRQQGARQLIAQAVEAELAQLLAQHADLRTLKGKAINFGLWGSFR